MAQQNLNRSEVRAGIEHVGGTGVPEQVRMNTTADAGAVASLSAQHSYRCIFER